MLELFEGQCQCGELRYQVTGETVTLFVCHCTECQRQSSSAFGMALWLRNYNKKIVSGVLKTWVRKTPSGRELVCEFCPNCGSRVFHRIAGQTETMSIKAGTLDKTRELEPVAHIWTSSAQRWVRLPEACLLYTENPPDFAELFAAWRAHKSAAYPSR
jgi:hypothetical protein